MLSDPLLQYFLFLLLCVGLGFWGVAVREVWTRPKWQWWMNRSPQFLWRLVVIFLPLGFIAYWLWARPHLQATARHGLHFHLVPPASASKAA